VPLPRWKVSLGASTFHRPLGDGNVWKNKVQGKS